MSTQSDKILNEFLSIIAQKISKKFDIKSKRVNRCMRKTVEKYTCQHTIRNGKNKGKTCGHILCKKHEEILPELLDIDHSTPVRKYRVIRYENPCKRKADEFQPVNRVLTFSDDPDPEYLDELQREINNVIPVYSENLKKVKNN